MEAVIHRYESVAATENKPSRLPPHSTEVEASVLGCILAYPHRVASDIARLGINRSSFYELHHIALFEAVQAVMRDGLLPDSVTVAQRLKAENKLEQAGGMEYMALLPDVADVLFEQYVMALHDLRNRRDVLKQLSTIEARAHDLLDPLDTLRADMDAALALSHRTTKGVPDIVKVKDLLARQIAPPRELVYGVLNQGAKLVLGGGSKSFKTWTLLDLALAVSHGEPWLSFKVSRGKVLYVNFELSEYDVQRRISAIAQAKHIQLNDDLDCLNMRGHAASYDVLFPKIVERTKTANYALIVLDPIYKCYGGTDENSAGQVALMLNAIEKLTTETGAAVAFGAHYAKGNAAAKEAIDRISGSGVFARDPDTILSFTRHQEANAFTVEATLRSFKPLEPFVVRWDYPLMRRDENLDPAQLKGRGAGRAKGTSLTAVVALLNEPKTTKQWQEAAETELGVSRSGFYRFKQMAEAQALVEQTADQMWCVPGASLRPNPTILIESGTGTGTVGLNPSQSQSQTPKAAGTGTETDSDIMTRQE